MAQLKQGDVVSLKSGGPTMTVENVTDKGVECVWFEKNQAKRGAFPEATLVAVKPGPTILVT